MKRRSWLVLLTLLLALTITLIWFTRPAAHADIDAALVRDPNNPSLYVERGRAFTRIYEWDRALADFDRAVMLAPDRADAYYYRGLLYASAPGGREAQLRALEDFRRCLGLAPQGEHAAQAAEYIRQLEAALAS
jgi:tetratricopeptide (TPR) repeat protein